MRGGGVMPAKAGISAGEKRLRLILAEAPAFAGATGGAK